MIVKPAKQNGYLLGCTNYRKDGTGCNHIINKKPFYDMMGYAPDPPQTMRDDEALSGTKQTSSKGSAEHTVIERIRPSEPETKEKQQSNESVQDIQIKKGNFETVFYNGQDLNDIVCITLNALQHVSNIRFYGVTILVDVLSGNATERLTKAKLDLIPEYAKLSKLSRKELYAVIDWLIANHYMLKTKGQYPVLHSTYDGIHYDEKMNAGQLKQLKRYLEVGIY